MRPQKLIEALFDWEMPTTLETLFARLDCLTRQQTDMNQILSSSDNKLDDVNRGPAPMKS